MAARDRLSNADADIQILADFQPRQRWLTMLATYIDDSGRGQRPTFVFAGFVARAEHWIAFNHDWQGILDRTPRIPYFKTVPAMAPWPARQFKGWSRKQVDARICELMGVIKDNRLARASISVPYEDFEANFRGRIASGMNAPYFFAAFRLIARTIGGLYLQGCRERVQFIFDTTGCKEQTEILRGWHLGGPPPPRVRPLMGDPPSFRDDKVTPALQAADLYAWHLRKARNLQTSSVQWDHPHWKKLSALPLVIEDEVSAIELAEFAERIGKLKRDQKLQFPYDPKPSRSRASR